MSVVSAVAMFVCAVLGCTEAQTRAAMTSQWQDGAFFAMHQARFASHTEALRASLDASLKHGTIALAPSHVLELLRHVRDHTSPLRREVGEVAVTTLIVRYLMRHVPDDDEVLLAGALHAWGKILALGSHAWAPPYVFGEARPLGVVLHKADALFGARAHWGVDVVLPEPQRKGTPWSPLGLADRPFTCNHAVELARMLEAQLPARTFRLLRLCSAAAWRDHGAYRQWESCFELALRTSDVGAMAFFRALRLVETPAMLAGARARKVPTLRLSHRKQVATILGVIRRALPLSFCLPWTAARGLQALLHGDVHLLPRVPAWRRAVCVAQLASSRAARKPPAVAPRQRDEPAAHHLVDVQEVEDGAAEDAGLHDQRQAAEGRQRAVL